MAAPSEASLQEFVPVTRERAQPYRYRRVSEWVFDCAFGALLNLGNWVTAVAFGIRAGFTCFHQYRTAYRRARIENPPVWMIDEDAAAKLRCPGAKS